VGGIVGAIFLTFFIRDSWMAEAAEAAGGSWTTMQQLGVQLTAVGIAIAYAAIGTLVILFVLDKIVKLRSSDEGEMKGLDNFYHGERGYGMTNPN
jgi:Amt family ammonium transporter